MYSGWLQVYIDPLLPALPPLPLVGASSSGVRAPLPAVLRGLLLFLREIAVDGYDHGRMRTLLEPSLFPDGCLGVIYAFKP